MPGKQKLISEPAIILELIFENTAFDTFVLFACIKKLPAANKSVVHYENVCRLHEKVQHFHLGVTEITPEGYLRKVITSSDELLTECQLLSLSVSTTTGPYRPMYLISISYT